MDHLRYQGKGNGRIQRFHFRNELCARGEGSAEEETDPLTGDIAHACPQPLLRRELIADDLPVAQIADHRALFYFHARLGDFFSVRKRFYQHAYLAITVPSDELPASIKKERQECFEERAET